LFCFETRFFQMVPNHLVWVAHGVSAACQRSTSLQVLVRISTTSRRWKKTFHGTVVSHHIHLQIILFYPVCIVCWKILSLPFTCQICVISTLNVHLYCHHWFRNHVV
jgi:hypothetical protein